MAKKTVVVAMSGGADSTYAAYLLKKKGYKVVGMMAKFWSDPNCEDRVNACCTDESVAVAHRNAKKLGIEFIVTDLSAEFKDKVVDYYIEEYKNCRTPNPCVVCNRQIKFGLLYDKAKKIGADYFATGHYTRLRREIPNSKIQMSNKSQIPNPKNKGTYFLAKAADKAKDQSYFLWNISPEILPNLLFPLGEFIKKDVLIHLKKLGLEIMTKESQDVCFIASGGNEEFLAKHIKDKVGDIVDEKGNILGRHNGLFRYTVGQRHGLGISSSDPKYVLKLNCQKNELIVGLAKSLEKSDFEISSAEWFIESPPELLNLTVKLRFGANSIACQIIENKVKLKVPARAITPGQSAVFYQDDILVGGGIIN